ncbi:hypothetical protein GOEFS_036_00020 [Gordonia effusa NBRC 100432]|uniref:Luciferase-like domain-containing protein n=1 Tax=Gordonia effusa NBRC 100432 TaxID=1077974 RepID=H0QXL3_9ACTN|nr:hypothetical protein [Gordonia effusa]GAB17564.1 hypothetical protein GOEFS_036_00020 [Gordonia effusa NBRC 100432]
MTDPRRTVIALRAGGWHPGAAKGARPQELTDQLISDATMVLCAQTPPAHLAIDNHMWVAEGDEQWVQGEVGAVQLADHLAGATGTTLVPTVAVADIDAAILTDQPTPGALPVDIQVRVGKLADDQSPVASPYPPAVDLSSPDFLGPMAARFQVAEQSVAAIRAEVVARGCRPRRLWALAHISAPYRFAAAICDRIAVTPGVTGTRSEILHELTELTSAAGSRPLIYADVTACLGETAVAARARMSDLDERVGEPFRCDTEVVVGSVDDLARWCTETIAAGFDGVRVRPCGRADLAYLVRSFLPSSDRTDHR